MVVASKKELKRETMTEKELSFICFNCQKETTVTVEVAKPLPTQSKGSGHVCYCKHCKLPNRIEVPDNLDVHVFILGRDKERSPYTSDGIPLLQGKEEGEKGL